MSKKKVLIIAEELSPYTFENDIANLVGKLPQAIHESGMEVRILMPKFGIINERRHRLHEVVRLSGMNIIIDDDDYPLIISGFFARNETSGLLPRQRRVLQT